MSESLSSRIDEVRQQLQQEGLDGWLLYDFRGCNDLACAFLGLAKGEMMTRRFFYWIPRVGSPVKLLHRIESNHLAKWPGEKRLYASWEELEKEVGELVKGSRRVAMEYSHHNALPYLSKVDGGTIELVRSFGVEVVSSANLLLPFNSLLDEQQFKSHLAAERLLEETAIKALQWTADNVSRGITEYDVQQLMVEEFAKQGCITDHPPICAVGEHSADPHYAPQKGRSSTIKKGDLILLDLWCKQERPHSIYADITRVGVLASTPTPKQKEIFQIVKEARNQALDFMRERLRHGQLLRGCDVDHCCREVIAKAGYQHYFTHRTGHSIHEQVHGNGTHIDSFETNDERKLIPRMLFSIEPGIYLPEEFGVRLECDAYISPKNELLVSGKLQEELITL